MPIVREKLNSMDDSFLRPVVHAIVEDLKQLTKIPMATKFFFLNPSNGVLQSGSGLEDSEDKNISGSDQAVIVEIEEEYTTETTLTTTVFKRNSPIIFADASLDLYLSPVYTQTNYTMSFKARFDSKSAAQAWRNAFRGLLSLGTGVNTHVVNYNYPIPETYLLILSHIHKLREKQGGYNQTIKEWLLPHFVENITTITNLVGDNPRLVIAETQGRVNGFWDVQSVPDIPEDDKERNVWTITVPYKFSISKPIEMVMQYPNMVHNTLLNAKYRFNDTAYRDTKENPKYDFHGYLNWEIAKPPLGINATNGLSYPNWDDWLPKLQYPYTFPIMRMMIQLDPTDLTDVVNLNNLGDYKLDHDLLAMLVTEAPHISAYRESFFKVTLYEDFYYNDSEPLFVNNTLAIRSTRNLNIRKSYHLVLSFLYDLLLLSDSAKNRLRANGRFLIRLINIFYPGIPNGEMESKLLSNGSMSLKDFNYYAGLIADYYSMDNRKQTGTRMLVGAYVIEGHRRG